MDGRDDCGDGSDEGKLGFMIFEIVILSFFEKSPTLLFNQKLISNHKNQQALNLHRKSSVIELTQFPFPNKKMQKKK